MMRSNLRVTCGFSAVVLAGLMASGSALANDYKVFPGAQCQVEGSGNYADGTAPKWSLWGGAYQNTHTTYDHVICPFTRDNVKNTDGTASASVRIYNPGTGRGFWCELWSSGMYGGAGTVPGFPSFPAPLQSHHVDATVIGLSQLNLDTSISRGGGYYSLHCEVPPNGYIYSYVLNEWGPTDTQ